ncbi:hypothetical protein CPAR01_06667 [Colletotrichum paranaense]|uniref:DUF952 domain-containing protein n=2 Tax=Colletotrichum acutatum species complex TaxID=2707335 RepID=A0ABQ9SMC7_9PEZI|nr:uncharacterized protein CPAR01_06667 [Colletotrichum paranaense]XP_060388677.1 uncharacterized protein CTAM01_01173 [Colletotrichum tamarilloi]KAK1512243.1 hypothetical protein CTAM01_01173 [Colletotrichum tamarilloi]KAK1540678.1 hypothetical protein CPAR01_06667 [Colletotrichum paranaense]
MAEPAQTPQYIYKIVPEAPPSPLPTEFPLSDLDRNDGFIHLSTAEQVLNTANLFFSSATSLYLLKLPYAPLAASGSMKWEFPPSGKFPSAFPHLYGRNFGAADVEDAKGFERAEGQVWSEVLGGDAWLV